MNSVSWLIYAGEVSENIKSACGIVLVIGGLAGAAVSVVSGIEGAADAKEIFGGWLKAAPAIALLCLIIVLMPSRSTLTLIAASEVGETVLASKDVQAIGGEAGALATDSLKLLRKYVTEELAGADAK